MSDSNKKQLIIDAANTMFNQNNTNVTVRLAQSGDKPTLINKTEQQIRSNNETTINKTSVENTEKKTIEQPVKELKENISKTEENSRLESDQEKMVLELFDGKYVE